MESVSLSSDLIYQLSPTYQLPLYSKHVYANQEDQKEADACAASYLLHKIYGGDVFSVKHGQWSYGIQEISHDFKGNVINGMIKKYSTRPKGEEFSVDKSDLEDFWSCAFTRTTLVPTAPYFFSHSDHAHVHKWDKHCFGKKTGQEVMLKGYPLSAQMYSALINYEADTGLTLRYNITSLYSELIYDNGNQLDLVLEAFTNADGVIFFYIKHMIRGSVERLTVELARRHEKKTIPEDYTIEKFCKQFDLSSANQIGIEYDRQTNRSLFYFGCPSEEEVQFDWASAHGFKHEFKKVEEDYRRDLHCDSVISRDA